MPRPRGKQIVQAQKVVVSVPVISGKTPKAGGSKSGAHLVVVKNSAGETSVKNSKLGTSKATTMPTVTRIEINAQRASAPMMMRSPVRLPREVSDGRPPEVLLVALAATRVGYPARPAAVVFAVASC